MKVKYDVSCPTCCGTFLQTTAKYNSAYPVEPYMLELKEDFHEKLSFSGLSCPSCGGSLVYGDFLARKQPVSISEGTPAVAPVEISTDETEGFAEGAEDTGEGDAPLGQDVPDEPEETDEEGPTVEYITTQRVSDVTGLPVTKVRARAKDCPDAKKIDGAWQIPASQIKWFVSE